MKDVKSNIKENLDIHFFTGFIVSDEGVFRSYFWAKKTLENLQKLDKRQFDNISRIDSKLTMKVKPPLFRTFSKTHSYVLFSITKVQSPSGNRQPRDNSPSGKMTSNFFRQPLERPPEKKLTNTISSLKKSFLKFFLALKNWRESTSCTLLKCTFSENQLYIWVKNPKNNFGHTFRAVLSYKNCWCVWPPRHISTCRKFCNLGFFSRKNAKFSV